MELVGEERIEAPRDTVWAALNDTGVLMQCIPGCTSLEWTSDTDLDASIKLRIGVLSMHFSGTIRLSKLNPPQSYRISAEGKGGVAGFAKGSVAVTLSDAGDETVLHYRGGVEIEGKLAQLGSRLVGSSSQKLASRFFANFNSAVIAYAAARRDGQR